jgi:putative DNA methylase
MTSRAVNTCIAFVARKSSEAKRREPLGNIAHKIKTICDSEYLPNLIEWGWDDNDAALAVFAHGVGLLANVQQVEHESDLEAMTTIEQIIRGKVPSFKIVKRKSL